MKTESIEKKCGAFGMICILCSVTLGILVSLAALIALIVCVGKCIL